MIQNQDVIRIFRRMLAAAALMIGVFSCSSAKSSVETDKGMPLPADSLSRHGSPMPEGFIPTAPPVVVPHVWNE